MQVELKAPGGKPGWKKRAAADRRRRDKELSDLFRAGCTCDLSPGYSSTDPMCPLHGLPAYRRDDDRR